MLYLTRNRAHDGVARPFENGIDRLFEEMTRGFGAAEAFEPSLEVSETAGEWRVKTDLPGVAPEDVEVSVTGNLLTIRGEKKLASDVKEDQFHRIERRYGTFSRSFSLPQTVDAGKVAAEYKNGVLTVRLPLREEAKPRQIKVDVAA